MKNSYFIGVVALIVIGGVFLYLNSMKKESAIRSIETAQDGMMLNDEAMIATSSNENAMMMNHEGIEASDTMMMKEGDMMVKPGSYLPYDASKIALAKTGKVVLDFSASWCPTCQGLKADILAHVKDIPSDLTILEVDYDNSAALKQKYGVTYQHTMVQVDENGKLIKKWSGSPTLVAFVAEVK